MKKFTGVLTAAAILFGASSIHAFADTDRRIKDCSESPRSHACPADTDSRIKACKEGPRSDACPCIEEEIVYCNDKDAAKQRKCREGVVAVCDYKTLKKPYDEAKEEATITYIGPGTRLLLENLKVIGEGEYSNKAGFDTDITTGVKTDEEGKYQFKFGWVDKPLLKQLNYLFSGGTDRERAEQEEEGNKGRWYSDLLLDAFTVDATIAYGTTLKEQGGQLIDDTEEKTTYGAKIKYEVGLDTLWEHFRHGIHGVERRHDGLKWTKVDKGK